MYQKTTQNITNKLETGLSGCSLEVINDKVLRKRSPSIEYDSRLLSQAEKQKVFANRIYKNVDAPKVYDVQSDYFDMEYIPGNTFSEFFSTASVNDVEFVVQTLFDYFDSLISTSRMVDVKSKLLKKLDSLEEKTFHKQYIGFLRKYVETNSMIVPHTFCHGDLTFSNIIFHRNRLFFVDFLDCYVDTYLSDLVKLKQDLYYFWGMKTQRVESLRIEQIFTHIWNRLYTRYNTIINSNAFKLLDVLNTLRIEPYLTSISQRSILDTMIKSTELYANFSSSNGGTL